MSAMLSQQTWLAVSPWMHTMAGPVPGHSCTASETPPAWTRGMARLLLVLDGRRRLLGRELADQRRDQPRHVRLGHELEDVHALERLVVLLAEDHLALGRLELHALHGGDQLLGGGAARLLDSGDDGHGRREATAGEEVGRLLEALLVLGHEPGVDRILRDLVVVVGAADHPLEVVALESLQHVEHVAAARDYDAALVELARDQLGIGAALARPDDGDVLRALRVLERAQDLLDGRGEVGRVPRRVLFVDDLGPELLDLRLVGGDAVLAEGVVLGDRGDRDARLGDGQRVGDGILARRAAGAEDVAIPMLARDAVGDGRLDQQHLLELGRHRQDGQRRGARRGPDDQVHLVVGVELGHLLLGDVGLELVVLDQHLDLAPEHFHLAARGVLEPELEARDGLLGVDLEGPRDALHQPDLDRRLRQRRPQHDSRQGQHDHRRHHHPLRHRSFLHWILSHGTRYASSFNATRQARWRALTWRASRWPRTPSLSARSDTAHAAWATAS